MLTELTFLARKSDARFFIDQLIDYDFLEIAYGILLNANTDSKERMLRLLDNFTLDSEKIWLKIHTEGYLFNAIVDLMISDNLKLRLEALYYIVNFIAMANPEML